MNTAFFVVFTSAVVSVAVATGRHTLLFNRLLFALDRTGCTWATVLRDDAPRIPPTSGPIEYVRTNGHVEGFTVPKGNRLFVAFDDETVVAIAVQQLGQRVFVYRAFELDLRLLREGRRMVLIDANDRLMLTGTTRTMQRAVETMRRRRYTILEPEST